MARNNGENASNTAFVRFIFMLCSRRKAWQRPANPVIAYRVLSSFIETFPAGKAERGKLRGQMNSTQAFKEEGAQPEELVRAI